MTATLPPGPELDAAVHAALGCPFTGTPRFSTDATAAIMAYEQMNALGWYIQKCQDCGHPGYAPYWRITLYRPSEHTDGIGPSFAAAFARREAAE